MLPCSNYNMKTCSIALYKGKICSTGERNNETDFLDTAEAYLPGLQQSVFVASVNHVRKDHVSCGHCGYLNVCEGRNGMTSS